MLFLRSWLEKYIDLSNYTDSQISDTISLKSGECEEIKVVDDYFNNKVLIGKIENIRNHPNADKLRIFDVNIGKKGKVQIVSAAPNVADGLMVPVALSGATLPYLTIAPRKMRGEVSDGMCCGKSELGLETEFSSGLWELNDLVSDEQLGQSVCTALPKLFPKQTLFEIKYLQDKLSSCANHLGLSIELALCLQKPDLLRGLAKDIWFGKDFYSDLLNKIKLEKKADFKSELNGVNSFNVFELDIKNQYTLPHELQTQMHLTGKNLIGGIADLSNYLLYDIGQPSHYFDASKTDNLNWTIKKLEKSQYFKGLGQLKNTTLPADLTVMTDSNQNILTVPGVSGSSSTKTEYDTSKVYIELANFDQEIVARSSFAISYRSDSAKFWASGISPMLQVVYLSKIQQMLPASDMQALLLLNQGKNFENISNWLTNLAEAAKNSWIDIDLNYIISRLDDQGMDHWEKIVLSKLELLGDLKKEDKKVQLLPNSYYSRLATNEDVLFEISKLIGFENLAPQYLTFSTDSKTASHYQQINKLKNIFVDYGFSEVLNRPFLPQSNLLSTLKETNLISLEAISSQRQDEPFLRDSLFSSLAKVVSKNSKLGVKRPQVFELTKIYYYSKDPINSLAKKIDQGNTWEVWTLEAMTITDDPYQVTSVIHAISNKTNQKIEQVSKPKQTKIGMEYGYDLGQNMQIKLVEVNNATKKLFDINISKKVWTLKIEFVAENLVINDYKKYVDESSFSNVYRSFSLVIPKDLTWANLQKVLDNQKIEGCSLGIVPTERFSHLESQDILNFDVEFVSYSRNLKGEEIELWIQGVMNQLQEQDISVELR